MSFCDLSKKIINSRACMWAAFWLDENLFHNATCGWIQLKQGKVTTAQYYILKVKKRK